MKTKQSKENLYFYLIIIVFLFDVVGAKLFKYVFNNNVILYNIYITLLIPTYLFLYKSFIASRQWNKILNFTIIIWILICVPYTIILGVKAFLSTNYLIGLSLVVITILRFTYEQIRLDRNIFKHPLTWLSIGITLFYSTNFAYFAYFNEINSSEGIPSILRDRITLGNILLSLSYCALIICQIQNKSYSIK